METAYELFKGAADCTPVHMSDGRLWLFPLPTADDAHQPPDPHALLARHYDLTPEAYALTFPHPTPHLLRYLEVFHTDAKVMAGIIVHPDPVVEEAADATDADAPHKHEAPAEGV